MTDEPKIEEPKDVRLPFMVTASEAKAIDEWRYANHIPSRAEAMRILITRGLHFDAFDDAFELLTDFVFERAEREHNQGELTAEAYITILESLKRQATAITEINQFEKDRYSEILEKLKILKK